MQEYNKKNKEKRISSTIKTYPVPFPLKENQGNLSINTNSPSKPYKEQIVNQAFKFHSQGNISKATTYYKHFINQGFKDQRVFTNYGVILQNLGKLQAAELSMRKAIDIQPDYAEAHYNLGSILRELGKLKAAELSTRKAIELKPDLADFHSNLGSILRDLGKLKAAELSTRKAIKLNPNLANAHLNLGSILRDLGKSKEARLCSEKIMSLRSWSISGSYTFNYEM